MRPGDAGFRLAFDEYFEPAQGVVPLGRDQIQIFLHIADRFRIEFEQAFTPGMDVMHDARGFENSKMFGDCLPGETRSLR